MKLTSQQARDTHQFLFARAWEIMAPKRNDYSGNDVPFANFHKSELFGVAPWRGALIRLSDKLSRIMRLAEQGGQGQVKDESLIDTAADALNYVAITFGLILEAIPEEEAQRILDRIQGPDEVLSVPLAEYMKR